MLLFVVENFIVAFNPNHSKGSTSQEVPNFAHLPIPFRDSFPEQGLSLIKYVVIAAPDPAKFMHNVGGPPPNLPSLDTNPKLVFDRFASIRKTKNALFRDRSQCNLRPPFVDGHRFVPNKQHKSRIFTGPKWVPHLRPIETVVAR